MKQSERETEQGYVVVWILIVLSLLTAAFASMEFVVDERPPNPTMYWVFAISMLFAAFTMLVEAKRDLHVFCLFAAFAAFVTGIVTGAIALMGMKPHPVAASVAILCGIVIVLCLVYVFKNQYGKETLPNILREHFSQAAIFEVEGLQFAATQSNKEIPAGQGFEIQAFVQNCWDSERTFTFGLKAETRLSLNKAGLKFCKDPTVVLPGGAVAVISIPVLADPNAKGKHTLTAMPKVVGSGGLRVRRRRAQGYSSGIPAWLTLLGPLFGFIAWGGGMKFRANILRNKQGEGVIEQLPEIATEIIWKPDPTKLASISRAMV